MTLEFDELHRRGLSSMVASYDEEIAKLERRFEELTAFEEERTKVLKVGICLIAITVGSVNEPGCCLLILVIALGNVMYAS